MMMTVCRRSYLFVLFLLSFSLALGVVKRMSCLAIVYQSKILIDSHPMKNAGRDPSGIAGGKVDYRQL